MVKLLVEIAAVCVGVVGVALWSQPAAMVAAAVVTVVAMERHS